MGRRYLRGRKLSISSAFLLRVADAFLEVAFKQRGKSAQRCRLGGQVAVCKFDHIGDLLMITPFLRLLKDYQRKNGGQLLLIVGRCSSGCAEYLRAQGLCDEVRYLDAFGLARGLSLFRSIEVTIRDTWKLLQELRQKRLSAFIDLRPYSPNGNMLGVLSKAECIVGFGTRGMSELLDVEIPYDGRKPVGQMVLDALPKIGIPFKENLEYQGPALGELAHANSIPTVARFGYVGRRYIIAHADSGESSRNCTYQVWLEYFGQISRAGCMLPLLFVGASGRGASKIALQAAEALGFQCREALGTTSFEELLHLLSSATGALCIDSLVAHIAIAYRIPTLVLMVEPFSDQRSFPVASSIPNVVFGRGDEHMLREAVDVANAFAELCCRESAAHQ